MKSVLHLLFIMSFFPMNQAKALDLTFVSGGFQKEKIEEGPVDTKKTKFSLGMALEDMMSKTTAAYGLVSLEQISYSGDLDLDDSTNFKLGGGAKNYFAKIGENFYPYVGVSLFFENSKEYFAGNQTDISGIFYGLHLGMRYMLGDLKEHNLNDWQVFIDVDVPLFVSSLSSSKKTKTINADGTSTTTSETTKNELYADNQGKWDEVTLGVGLRF